MDSDLLLLRTKNVRRLSRGRSLYVGLCVLAGIGLSRLVEFGIPLEPLGPVEPALIRIDPNDDPLALFSVLPRIGPSILRRLEDVRTLDGVHAENDLDRLHGTGRTTVVDLRPYLTFNGPRLLSD
jgi:hypothetical protein